jgi:Leucine-rich repeat (LRR) protein
VQKEKSRHFFDIQLYNCLIPVLNDNNISYLNREEFASNLHLLNLQKIYLKQSRVKHVHREAFKNLKILIEIDLSDNEIETIDKQTFAGEHTQRYCIKEVAKFQRDVEDTNLSLGRTHGTKNCFGQWSRLAQSSKNWHFD